ncbi:GH92 family glycosyl hydrolase [Persicobacter diffluens]|uniref:Sugar hydrolase n=1 Tax=Persicobacter diffluens TaxID=981 RepID=A0AAN4VYT2_9BACT|nr:hypothetical protein PEDI_31080 [Persicobacter diffluens]
MKAVFKKITSLLAAGLFAAGPLQAQEDLVQYVDPRIGTAEHGHVFMGANVPFGAVQLGPSNVTQGWDWCSGYHVSDTTIVGFAHTHLSGTGIGDLGDVLLMPLSGKIPSTDRGSIENPESGYLSPYSHANEVAAAGFYSVELDRYQVRAELTSTERVGAHRYTFHNAKEEAHVLVNLKDGIGWDKATETSIVVVDEFRVEGYRHSKGWSEDQRLFFAIEFSEPVRKIAFFDDTKPVKGKTAIGGDKAKAVFSFGKKHAGVIEAKVAISPVSSPKAWENMKAEAPGFDFDGLKAKAAQKWGEALEKVKIDSKDESVKRTFYTAMFRTMTAPSLFNDHDGAYRGSDKKVYPNPGFDNLTTFSLWDTYRAAHPLYTITQPERVNDMVNSLLTIEAQQDQLPVWHLMGSETNTMVGFHSIPVIVDAYLKGFDGFDAEEAYAAIRKFKDYDQRGLNFVRNQEYIPADKEEEAVAKALEYAIDDYAIAMMAKKLGKMEDYDLFMKRAGYYRHYFDRDIQFMRGKLADGSWRTPYDPIKSTHREDDFCEGNGWQYTWLVPHDVEGLVDLFGSDIAFANKLDSLFIIEGDMGEGGSPDITGLIGQYAQGNEPGHHTIYLYNYVGQPWKTAEMARRISSEMFNDQVNGMPGNEDVGQMSAWYVFNALGFYPVNPVAGDYVLGSPTVDQAEIQVPGNKTFKVIAKNNSEKNIYIQSVKLEGKDYPYSFIRHEDIMKGGTLELQMGDTPSIHWGISPEYRPQSLK